MMAEVLERFKSLYSELNATNCSVKKLAEVYSDNVIFIDPFHSLQGLTHLSEYFEGMYENVVSCNFQFLSELENGDQGWINWEMLLCHKRLKSGKQVIVNGCTHIEIKEHKITLHRDFFDAGELLYENIPLLGSSIRMIKRAM